ncbi:unnamed protein product [Scytosiphon promiscuus]
MLSLWCRGLLLLVSWVLCGHEADATAKKFGPRPSLSVDADHVPKQTTIILVALRDSPDGEEHLKKWASFAEERGDEELAPVWIICPEHSPNIALVQDLAPHVQPFVVKDGVSWATVLRTLRLRSNHATTFGLFGEGTLPPAELSTSITSVEQALAGSLAPTVVLARSRSNDGDATAYAASASEWLPDTFISQVWCNRVTLTGTGLDTEIAFQDGSSFLQLLPKFIRAHQMVSELHGPEFILVDGTRFVQAVFDLGEEGREPTLVGNTAALDGGSLYFGMLDLALVNVEREEDRGEGQGGGVGIGAASWPPTYVLEHVASDEGLIIVNNVNCGYLDFATNFLLAARKVSDTKVLWVAMDETAFDFMDNLAPGCAAMFPSEDSERHHAIKAGKMGDETFRAQVLIRPNMLRHILMQGYTLLWTDSDMVWLGDPLPSLPDMHDSEAAELMIQQDGSVGNPCTCFLFMKPTELVIGLLDKWIQSIVEAEEWYEDQASQIPFRGPLHEQLQAGMKLEYFPVESFPSGKFFFDYPYEENYARIHYEKILIVHDNYIKGHERKRQRFEAYHLWDVGDNEFPSCER